MPLPPHLRPLFEKRGHGQADNWQRCQFSSGGLTRLSADAHVVGGRDPCTSVKVIGNMVLAGLWIKRHRMASVATGIVALTVAAAFCIVVAMWFELRGTASTFYDKSVALLSANKFGEALAPIDYAIRLDVKNAGFLLLRGHILECLLRLDDARQCYEDVLRLVPNHPAALENLKLCESLLQADRGKRELSSASLASLQAALRRQKGRGEQADAILRLWLARDEAARTRVYEECRARLDQAGLKGELKVEDNGRIGLRCLKTPMRDLAPLRGLPLNSLMLISCEISNISALAGMPLDDLDLEENPVADLAPLKGMKLKRLILTRARISDFRPLTGMPLEFLVVGASGITDLRPLIGLPLRELHLGELRVPLPLESTLMLSMCGWAVATAPVSINRRLSK
jgi:predicted outer membrane lipoprotein